jgi:hypothetical protein
MAVIAVALPASASAVEVAPGVQWTSIVREAGPQRINVLELDPALVHGVLSNGRIARRERVSAMARRTGAVAGVNGGYFATSGDPVGVLAIDGQLLSEPVDGRSALLVGGGEASVAPLRFRGSVTINGVTRLIDGLDRTRGLVPACGGRGGDRPTLRPNAALTCTDSSELVLLSPSYGARPPREGGVEAVLRDGTVARVRGPGTGRVPPDGLLLTGTGDAARFLRNAALPRSRAEVELTLTSAGRPIDLAQQALVVGGGPRLVRAGRLAVTGQPRTLAGVRDDGAILLVTVDGRRPGWSAGMTLFEAARLMRSLGARDALNLDGGGSSAMTVRGEVVNRPSDHGGERAVSDGVYALP